MARCEWCERDSEDPKEIGITFDRRITMYYAPAGIGSYRKSFDLSRPALLCSQCHTGRFDLGRHPYTIYWQPQVVDTAKEARLLFAYAHNPQHPSYVVDGTLEAILPAKLYATLVRVVKLAKEIYATGGDDLDTMALLKETWETEQGGADAIRASMDVRSDDDFDLSRSDDVEAHLAFEGGSSVDGPDREAGD